MTPENKIKRAILRQASNDGEFAVGPIDDDIVNDEIIENVYTQLCEADKQWDYESEFREGTVATNINPPYSRHYESKSVATQIDGEWIGWTFWYGGGKHGNPEDAYLLNCQEEQKLVTIQTFTKIE